MEEFNIVSFSQKLKQWFTESALFPYYEIGKESNFGLSQYSNYKANKQKDSSKHSNRNPTHLKDATKQCLNSTTVSSENTITFDYGNEELERNYPHYHILEDAYSIRKRGRATTKTKGTQDMIKEKEKRDYNYVYWNGKIFTKEYSRNVRGARNRLNTISHWSIVDGQGRWLNESSRSYLNVHYKYIEHILNEDVVQKLCMEFGLKVKRISDTGLVEEFANQEGTSVEKVLEVFGSFME